MPSPLFHPEIMDHDVVISSQHNGVGLPRETDQESREEDHQEALRFALDQLSLMALEKVDCGGGGGGGLVDSLDGNQGPGSEGCNGVGGGGYVDLQMLEHPNGSRSRSRSRSRSPGRRRSRSRSPARTTRRSSSRTAAAVAAAAIMESAPSSRRDAKLKDTLEVRLSPLVSARAVFSVC